jgi:hypothetical protein
LGQLTASVERCGIPRSEFEVSYEDYLRSEEIRVMSSSLDDETIQSLKAIERAAPFPIVTFVDPDVSRRSWELTAEHYKAESREWLRQQGLLDRLPLYDPDLESPMQFARRLEEFCGIQPGSVFEMNEQLNVITPKTDWIAQSVRKGRVWQKRHGAKHLQQFHCLMNAMSATDADEHGIRFGFIGNQATSDEEPEK